MMVIPKIPFSIINWQAIPAERHAGEEGHADWQIVNAGGIRIRRMEYAPGYKADHWCKKGHIIHCLEGSMTTELEDGRFMKLEKGQTYVVGDDCEAHRTFTEEGCSLLVVD